MRGTVDSRPDSVRRPDRGDSERPDRDPDALEILSGIADRQRDTTPGQAPESSRDAAGAPEGFSVPQRHRVEPNPLPDGLWDGDTSRGGDRSPPESTPDNVFVLPDPEPIHIPPAESPSPSPDRSMPIIPEAEPQHDDREPATPSLDAEEVVPAPPAEALFDATTELPAADVRRFPSDQAEQRAERFFPQGHNDRGYLGTCGLASSAQMISDLTGEDLTENDVVEYAATERWCETTSSDPTELGAIDMRSLSEVHREIGVDSYRLRDADVEQVADFVESGDGVLAAVNSAEYWPSDAFGSESDRSRTLAHPGTDHVVWVTGVSRDPGTGLLTGFYVNDTGRSVGAGTFLSTAEMRRAWEQRGGDVLVSPRGPS